jgi:hypothetical protein
MSWTRSWRRRKRIQRVTRFRTDRRFGAVHLVAPSDGFSQALKSPSIPSSTGYQHGGLAPLECRRSWQGGRQSDRHSKPIVQNAGRTDNTGGRCGLTMQLDSRASGSRRGGENAGVASVHIGVSRSSHWWRIISEHELSQSRQWPATLSRLSRPVLASASDSKGNGILGRVSQLSICRLPQSPKVKRG